MRLPSWRVFVVPGALLVLALVAYLALPAIGFLHHEHRWIYDILRAILALSLAWTGWRAVDVVVDAAARAGGHGSVLDRTIVPLLRRVLKLGVAALGAVMVLESVDVNVTGLLTGLGIGGLAVALAAQKTVEHVVGSIVIALDKPFVVGDFIRAGELTGTVEEVGLRSTRIRTLDKTLLAVPNGSLSTLAIENLGPRGRSGYRVVLEISYDATARQLRAVRDDALAILAADPGVAPESGTARIVKLGDKAVELEVACAIETRDARELSLATERLYLALLAAAARAGVALVGEPRAAARAAELAAESERRAA